MSLKVQDNYHDAQDVSAVKVVRMNLLINDLRFGGLGNLGMRLDKAGGYFL